MSIHVALNHVTRYRYDRAVKLGPQVIRLRPAPHSRTRILSYSLSVLPAAHFINWQQDAQANYLARLTIPERTREFAVEVDLVAEMAVLNPFDFFLEPGAEQFPFEYDDALKRELSPYLERLPSTPAFAAYLASVPREPHATADFLVGLNQRLSRDIGYLIRMEPGVQTPEQTLANASGSCRDSAWLLVQLLRGLGLAARFVSGYLIQLTADVKSLDGPSGPEADFTDLHAWCEVYLPGAGWIGLDATSGLLAGEGHIPLACSPEPGSAAPITGLVEPSEVEFEHTMSVRRVFETPRVTRPYRDAQWDAIVELGRRVDADLERLDVRLTMGGEPTFVAVDDPEGAEWNTAALGPTKRARATVVYNALREKYAPHGLVHFGQGKWYPGEQLPRWSLNCHWRNDGMPVWRDNALIADEAVDNGADADLAGRFLHALAARLGVDPQRVFPAYEDAYYYLWREHRLPSNVDVADSRLRDSLERERLGRVFARDLGAPIGHVLPLSNHEGAWRSTPWFLRDDECLLIPGDSPLGYRLPLDSQPWVDPAHMPAIIDLDPASERPPLADEPGAAVEADAAAETRAPAAGESADWITRTALCAQARGGTLYLFMPPLERFGDYLQLVGAIEACAAELQTPVLLEGYEPPHDPRASVFRVTPDPGVIEVNIHPAARWDDLVERTVHLYETAHAARLSAEKFMVDGRHVGTGGGNHFVLGGARPDDSPFLRRPDLLRSLVSYWLDHPSLSYLFSGLFIGPTSQAPRIDEARNDSLYELELAFQQFPPYQATRAGDARGQVTAGRRAALAQAATDAVPTADDDYLPPWLLDRLLRNILIDVTGNTHRTEFCIDKLFSPDGATGRLGLVELRAFEMPPHARMSLVQQLLLRALVARFWQQPYAPQKLTRWGTELHDRFLLPHFVAQDFAGVIAETNAAGYALDFEWFAPHLEFRFPKLGDLDAFGVDLELRHALEPWHVMGEEGSAGGAVRYVDSSLERLQVKVAGFVPERQAITCNGRRVPMHATGTVGEYVAGVRYRAWQPASALHPLLGVQAPLTFDLVDLASQRSLGGCEYHVVHPGGRSYDSFPVNAFEAESRRLARFFRSGHTAGVIDLPPLEGSAEFPLTLDLRRQ